MKTLSALVAATLLSLPVLGVATPISYGALSSDDAGATQIISDSLNNYEWLRWDTLQASTYEQALAATAAGGQYEGWQFARNTEAQMFTNALLQGTDNACTTTGDAMCNLLMPPNLVGLLGDTFGTTSERVNFLSDDGLGLAGFMQYFHEGEFGSLYKDNGGATTDFNGWLMYRVAGTQTPPSTSVPEPASLALFGLGLAGVGMARRRRDANAAM